MNKIEGALSKLFDKHRIVFWYDAKKELRKEFEAIDLDGIKKVELANNEFSVKYRMLRQGHDQKFLVYHEGKQPADLDNWLLDVLLANGEFRADQVAIWLAEMELGLEFAELFEQHQEFFKAARRREKFKGALKSSDTRGDMRLKMLATCCGSDPRIDSIMENLLDELAEDADAQMKLIQRCALDGFLYESLNRYYGYQSDAWSVKDFVLELFKSCFSMEIGEEADLNADALVFMKRWQNNRHHQKAFEKLSGECAAILDIESRLNQIDYRTLFEDESFKLVEMKILSELIHGLARKSISARECQRIVCERSRSYWYATFEHYYEAIGYAAEFQQRMDALDCSMESIGDALSRYTECWFRIDQLYRKFIFHVRSANNPHLISELANQIENQYTNNYLLRLNDSWQTFIDAMPSWTQMPAPRKNQFFKHWVAPYLERGKKVCVIISDAMRYEVGEELLARIRQQDRYDAQIESMVSMLPSYTQLGMAALLPHQKLAFADDETSTVIVDGQSSQGTANRGKILNKAAKAEVKQAEAFLSMNRDESREVTRENDVVYLYHNRIDKTGDTRDTEARVFETVEDTLDELVTIIKKLYAANASTVIVTSDHGFIYQNRKLDESDFSSVEPGGDKVLFRDRRFVLGKGLNAHASLKKFTADQLGMAGDMDVQLPKSINRLRRQGSGSRFVHGSSSLQEIVVPVIQVSKKRKSDVAQVDVDFLGSTSTVISTGQFTAALYQIAACDEKVQPRELRAGVYNEAGELISNTHELRFESTSDSARDRETKVKFVLTSLADKSNNQDVYLKLMEQVKGTSKQRIYKQTRYTIRRLLTSDFDF